MQRDGHSNAALGLMAAAVVLIAVTVFPVAVEIQAAVYLLVLLVAPGRAVLSLVGWRGRSDLLILVLSIGFSVAITMPAAAVMAYGGFWSTEGLAIGLAVLIAAAGLTELVWGAPS